MNAIRNLILSGAALASAAAWALPAIRVGADRRTLETADGRPFLWLADTAWELFHRLDREEAVRYLDNRRDLGFNVVQAVAIAEEDGVGTPNAYGFRPFAGRDPVPDVKDGPGNDYWDHVDFVVDEANRRGIYVALLPTWGRWWKDDRVFTADNAYAYAEWLARRYGGKGVVWVLGGDRQADSDRERAVIEEFARGLRSGDGGRNPITYHPAGGHGSSELFHDRPWLDFNLRQNGHEIDFQRYDATLADYRREPVKPVVDGEPVYEGHPVAFNPDVRGHTVAADVRRALYWDLFHGACGHTYGHHSIWQFHGSKRALATAPAGVNRPVMPWYEALDEPGAAQMRHGRDLVLANGLFARVPAPELIVPDAVGSLVPGAGTRRFAACRDAAATRALVYAPAGRPFSVDLSKLSPRRLRHAWFDPRSGAYGDWRTVDNDGPLRFTPPTPGELLDWVLVVLPADAAAGSGPAR